jgi:hypothetical protein
LQKSDFFTPKPSFADEFLGFLLSHCALLSTPQNYHLPQFYPVLTW